MLGDEIAIYLAAQASLGLTMSSTSASGIWSSAFPVQAGDTATCIIEYPGRPPVRAMGPSLTAPVFEQAKFQVLSRDTPDRALDCRALQKNIAALLGQFAGTLNSSTGGATVYGFVDMLQPPFFLKQDESARVYFACNYMALKQVSP